MKGFPNQTPDIGKLTNILATLDAAQRQGLNLKDDKAVGEHLLRQRLIGYRDKSLTVDEYLAEQYQKKQADQSFRAAARGILELLRHLDLARAIDGEVKLTPKGRWLLDEISEGAAIDELREAWRLIVRRMKLSDGSNESHPYQVLLRLIAKNKGLSRKYSPLALAAVDDSEKELDRMVTLAKLDSEDLIRKEVGATESNWDNAKKILASFAEQLGDVVKIDGVLHVAKHPGASLLEGEAITGEETGRATSSRRVTPDEIAKAGLSKNFDDFKMPQTDDPEKIRQSAKILRERLRRHNLIVRRLAAPLHTRQYALYENPMDCLACNGRAYLFEVKTLDGSPGDEVERVRDSLSQLLYYESFAIVTDALDKVLLKVAVFESEISDAHKNFLNKNDVVAIWVDDGLFTGSSFDGDLLVELEV